MKIQKCIISYNEYYVNFFVFLIPFITNIYLKKMFILVMGDKNEKE